MDYKAIQELIKTMSESKLTTLEIEADGVQIKMGKGDAVIVKSTPQVIVEEQQKKDIAKLEVAQDIQSSQAVVNKADENVIKKDTVIEVQKEDEKNIEVVVSPIVGTFYESSAPGEEPFVKVGSKVKAGDTLCIIEAMKLMNDIASEVDGEVVEILVKNEEMVEYGQPILKIVKS